MSKGWKVKWKFKLKQSGVREVLRSQEMRNAINSTTQDIVARCGDGYTGNTEVHNRAVGLVYPYTGEAYKDNLDNNTLLKAL